MLEEGILLFFVVLPTIIAWAVPQLRKRNGNFLITLKTVPVGVLTLYLMDKLITWFYRWFCEYKFENIPKFHFSIRVWIPIVIALLAITVSGWLIHKKFRVESRYNPLPSLLLFFPSLLAGEMFLFHGALAVTESGQGILLCGPSGVGKSTACRKLAGKMQTLAEDFILLSKFDGKWFAQAAPTWSVWGFDKEEIVVSDICKIVPLNYMVLLNRGEARLEEFGKYGASLALSASFNDMTNWQTRAAVVPRDMRRQLRTCAFEGVLDMTKKLSCYRMFSKLDTDIGELLAVLK